MSLEPADHTLQTYIKSGTIGKNAQSPNSESQKEVDKKLPKTPGQMKMPTETLPKIQETSFFTNRTRHVILLISTLCLTMLLSNILLLNVTMICMTGTSQTKETTIERVSNSSSDRNKIIREKVTGNDNRLSPPDFETSPGMRNLIFASAPVGALICTPMSVLLLRLIGARKTFALAGMLSATATALTPLAVRGGVPTFVAARFIQGAGLSSIFPVIGGVSAGWSSLKYSGLFLSVITNFVQLAPMFTLPVAGVVCETDAGWSMAYYIHVVITVIFFTMWTVFFKDSPQTHRWTTEVEIRKIREGKPPIPSPPQPVPYCAILSSLTIWVILLTALANFAGIQLFIIYMSTFFFNALDYSLKDACLLAALPPLAQLFAKIIAGILGDRQYSFLSGTSKVRVFNSIASIGAAVFLLALAFVPSTERFWSIFLLMVSASLLGFNTSGLFRSPSLVARHHTHFIMTIIQVLLCGSLLGMPFVVDFLVRIKAPKDWSLVFGAVAFFLLITSVLFCVFAKGSPAPWTAIKESSVKIHPAADALSPPTIKTEANSISLSEWLIIVQYYK